MQGGEHAQQRRFVQQPRINGACGARLGRDDIWSGSGASRERRLQPGGAQRRWCPRLSTGPAHAVEGHPNEIDPLSTAWIRACRTRSQCVSPESDPPGLQPGHPHRGWRKPHLVPASGAPASPSTIAGPARETPHTRRESRATAHGRTLKISDQPWPQPVTSRSRKFEAKDSRRHNSEVDAAQMPFLECVRRFATGCVPKPGQLMGPRR